MLLIKGLQELTLAFSRMSRYQDNNGGCAPNFKHSEGNLMREPAKQSVLEWHECETIPDVVTRVDRDHRYLHFTWGFLSLRAA